MLNEEVFKGIDKLIDELEIHCDKVSSSNPEIVDIVAYIEQTKAKMFHYMVIHKDKKVRDRISRVERIENQLIDRHINVSTM